MHGPQGFDLDREAHATFGRSLATFGQETSREGIIKSPAILKSQILLQAE